MGKFSINLKFLFLVSVIFTVLTSFSTVSYSNAQSDIMDMLNDLGLSGSETFQPKPDNPSTQPGFLVDDDTLYSIDYPSNWTKDSAPLGKYTALDTTAMVEFSEGQNSSAFVVVTMNVIGNRLLTDYANEEIEGLKTIEGFKLDNSTQTKMGGNTAQQITYTTSEIKDGVLVGDSKTMEIITIKDGTAHHLVYKANLDDFERNLPLVEKMINSFKFKELTL